VKLSPILALLLAASLVFAIATNTSACQSNDIYVPGPTAGPVFPCGVVIGALCTGKAYVMAYSSEEIPGPNYAYCEGGVWLYTTNDPADAGYAPTNDCDCDDETDAAAGDSDCSDDTG
jgi:hypothetical protein